MAEKRDGFGVKDAAGNERKPPLAFETPDYEVIIGSLSGPAETPQELRFRYVIRHKKQGVIYGTAGGLGQAIAAAVQAQIELSNATSAAQEYASRNYNIKDEKDGPVIPNFGNMN